MKKWMALLLAVLMVFALVACTNEEKPEGQTPDTNEEPQKPQENEPEKEPEAAEATTRITLAALTDESMLPVLMCFGIALLLLIILIIILVVLIIKKAGKKKKRKKRRK